jgi:hypothetical protein
MANELVLDDHTDQVRFLLAQLAGMIAAQICDGGPLLTDHPRTDVHPHRSDSVRG